MHENTLPHAGGLRTAALDALPTTRRQILLILKREAIATAAEIAGMLEITASAVRQHLGALTRDGLLAYERAVPDSGRPKHRYMLTAAGDALFPRNYVDLTNELLSYIGEEDSALLTRVWDRRTQARIARGIDRMAGKSFADRVAQLAQILDEDGYLADFTDLDDGSFRLTEHNCAVLAVAQRDRHACSTELDFFRALLPDAEIERVAHRLESGHVCAYSITQRKTVAE